ncbi:unnamed protein product [Blepharisma stoltei]|uniref:U3 small nucleolar RNA-associated protein 13 C-terminal domain-containing protein n=1 Tax=Blepharisma stoltei TaxID=1481888 RepID=A0AAU9JBZ5_9CILI|nr:unnamed protein product [Blepharisma stoltei]
MKSQVWRAEKVFRSVFAGGKLCVDQEGTMGFSLYKDQVICFSLENFQILSHTGEDVTCFDLTKSGTLVTSGVDNIIRFHKDPPKIWKSDCAITILQVDPRDALLATGGSDNSIRVYQLEQSYLTHCFKQHSGPILSLSFHPTEFLLASSSHDYSIRVFDLMKYSCRHTITMQHPTRFVAFLEKSLVTCTSDEAKLWSIKKWEEKGVYKAEGDISAIEISGGVWIGEDSGNVVNLSKNKLEVKRKKQVTIFGINLIKHINNEEMLVSNQEFSMYFLNNKLKLQKEIIGDIDEILDLKWINESKVALALNSTEAKLFDINTSLVQSLKGHTDNILCIDIFGEYIATASRDQTMRYWHNTKCLAVYKGHTEEVISVAISKKNFLVTSSQDRTIKIWEKSEGEIATALQTTIAHEKDIGVVRLSPDSKRIASGSHDKTIKLWNKKLANLQTLEGHKRGIWDLIFHPSDRILASSSGDMTVKLWSLETYSCIRTLEGHTNAVLKLAWIPSGIASVSSDNLLKIWNFKTGTCVLSLEEHNDKIWAIGGQKINEESFLLTGGIDSKLVLWKDITEQEETKQLEEKREAIKQEQLMQNKLKSGDKVEAALIAHRLKRPQMLYKITQEMTEKEVILFVDTLLEDPDGLLSLLTHIRDWNSMKKYSSLAQRILYEIFDRVSYSNFPNVSEILQAISVYSQKHYQRAEKLCMQSYQLDHILNEMTLLPKKRTKQEDVVSNKKIHIS